MFQELLLCIQQHSGKVVDQYFWTIWSAQERNLNWSNANIPALLSHITALILRMQGSYAQVKLHHRLLLHGYTDTTSWHIILCVATFIVMQATHLATQFKNCTFFVYRAVKHTRLWDLMYISTWGFPKFIDCSCCCVHSLTCGVLHAPNFHMYTLGLYM